MRALLILFGCYFLVSCTAKDDDFQEENLGNAKVVILNEGNYNFGNASISIYNDQTKETINKIFQANNNGRPIGDVVQSAYQIDDELFIIVNNSSKIEIVNALNFKSVGSIQNLNSPRYLLPVSENKAYLSDLYEDKLYIIDPKKRVVLNTIDTKGWVEEIAFEGNFLFGCHVDSHQVWVWDMTTDQLVHKINTHLQPQSIKIDVNQKAWVSCSGGLSGGKSAIYQINATTFNVDTILESPLEKMGKLELNNNKSELYYLTTRGIYQFDVHLPHLPSTPQIAAENRLFYNFSIHPVSNEIYISDAIDYQQNGVVYRYDQQGNRLDAFKVGVIPSEIVFLK